MLPAAQLELATQIALWKEAQAKAAKFKEEELELRKSIAAKWFPVFEEGTQTGSLSDGFNLKCGMALYRSVGQEEIKAAYAFANTLHNDPEIVEKAQALKELLDRVFRIKYELELTEWRELTDDDRRKLADIVTEKPGETPSLKYEEKKS